MFFNRYNRIKTQPKIPGKAEQEIRQNKRKAKLKKLRFSCQHQVYFDKETEEKSLQIKKFNFIDRLPGIQGQFARENQRDQEKQKESQQERNRGQLRQLKEKKQMSVQNYRKKDSLLNSILQILKPNTTSSLPYRPLEIKRNNKWESTNQFSNEFIEDLPQHNTTKHHRTPKIIENQMMKSNHNIVRRKIFSEDKDRQRMRDQVEKRADRDLQKIQILTFANKFPYFKKNC